MASSQHRCVFVGNIPYDATEEQLFEICQEVGPVASFRLVIDRETGKPKGYEYCEYKDEETVLSARCNRQGYEINGRQLRVDFAENDKGSDRNREQRILLLIISGAPFLHLNFNAHSCDHILPTLNPAHYLARLDKFAPFYFQTILSFASFASANPELAGNSFENAKKRREKWTKAMKFSWKSVSFIGLVEGPLNVQKSDGHKLRVWTYLRVRPSSEPTSEFRVLLKMWDEMAESCLGRLKPYDLIYVEGPLQSYKMTDMNGGSKLCYQITAKKLNHVDQYGPESRNQSSKDIQSEDVKTRLERQKDRLHLWHVFFSSPDEWYDCRKTKFNPTQPDFKHKDTGEALWLNPDDPPWIMKQLHMLDARRTEENKHSSSQPPCSFSKWL